ncbi:hypothetical protein PYCC9005_004895 [Savitreella phatthalungensis]
MRKTGKKLLGKLRERLADHAQHPLGHSHGHQADASDSRPGGLYLHIPGTGQDRSMYASGQPPKGPVFGVPLATAAKNAPFDSAYDCPAVVGRCIEYLESDGRLDEEGLYRVPGSGHLVGELRDAFNQHGDIDLLRSSGIHATDIASLLKLYLRELPKPIVPSRQAHALNDHYDGSPNDFDRLEKLLLDLPAESLGLLRILCTHLNHVQAHAHANLMDLNNLGIVFTATSNLNLSPALMKQLMSSPDILQRFKHGHEYPSSSRTPPPQLPPLASPSPFVPMQTSSATRVPMHTLKTLPMTERISEPLEEPIPISPTNSTSAVASSARH